MARPRRLLWLLVFALLAAQTLAFMHRVVHGDPGMRAALVRLQQAGRDAAQAAHGLGSLLSAHDESGCRVYDQLGQGGMLPLVPALPLPALAPAFFILWFQGESLARWAALFDARGPPTLR